MKKYGTWALCFLAGIIVASVVISLLQSGMSDAETPMTMDQDMSAMQHGMLEIDTRLLVPSITLEAFDDEKSGYNLHLITENYVFTPENISTEPVQGEGHAHIYVNGVKLGRLYAGWYHLPASELRMGENTVEVTLNANDHSDWMMEGQHILSSVVVSK
jgi:hypothetical protein